MFSTSRLEPPSPSHPPFLPSTSPLLWKMEELCGLLFSLTHGVIPAHLQLGDKWEFNYFQRVRETEKLVTSLPFASHWEMKYVILVKKWTFIPPCLLVRYPFWIVESFHYSMCNCLSEGPGRDSKSTVDNWTVDGYIGYCYCSCDVNNYCNMLHGL